MTILNLSRLLFLFLLLFCAGLFPQAQSLNGEWQFAVDSTSSFSIENVKVNAKWRSAVVPMSWQAQFPELRDYQGIAWYRKTFSIDEVNDSDVVLIKFDAVDYLSRVYINNKLAGEHEGGYTPFEHDITGLVNKGSSEVIVCVMDPADTEKGTEGISYRNIPHGKQNWYVQTSGLWQGAEIKIKPKIHIKKFHLTPSIDGNIEVDISLSEKVTQNEFLNLTILSPSGEEVSSLQKNIKEGDNSIKFILNIKSPSLWSFDAPNLYSATVTIGTDKVTDKFGFRSFEARDKKLYLNNEPFYLIAALDQDFYPETIYTVPSEEFIRDEMLKAKKLGLNMLRCHIKVPDPIYLKVADEVGLLVWYEIPNWDFFSPEAAKRGEETMDRMLERDWNHPSIVVLSIINESWGIDLQKAEQRKWLLEAFDRIKSKAIGRLVVDNSACWGNYHLKTDINDYHTYWAIPENRNMFDKSITDLAARPKTLFSEFGDSHETGEEPLILSEFGNWGLPKLPSKIPWWLERPYRDYENVVTLPEGVHQRFIDYKYNNIFTSYDKLAEESQWAQFTALKYEIESIRIHPEIQGYVITEFTDLNWESNGLLDMWRNMKVYAKELNEIQQQDLIIPRPSKYNFKDGENAKIKLWLSHFSDHQLANAIIKWNIPGGQEGSISVPEIKKTEVVELPAVQIRVTANNKPSKIKINFEFIDNKGNSVSKNFCEVFVYPESKTSAFSLYDPMNQLNQLSKNAGGDSDNNVIITNVLDDTVVKQLNEGKTVLCFADTNIKVPSSFPYKIVKRDSDWLDGNWASNFNWVRNNNALFAGMIGRLGFEIAEVKPQCVVSGIPAENFNDVLSGMFVGWVQMNSGYVIQMSAGMGKLIICTIPVHQKATDDAFSSWLFNKLLEYSASTQFNPGITWNLE